MGETRTTNVEGKGKKSTPVLNMYVIYPKEPKAESTSVLMLTQYGKADEIPRDILIGVLTLQLAHHSVTSCNIIKCEAASSNNRMFYSSKTILLIIYLNNQINY